MKNLFIPLIFMFLIFGCKPEIETVEIKNDAGVLIEKYQRRTADFARQGLYEKFDSAGKLEESANYQNDTLHGKRTIFSENGQVQYLENYDRGAFAGEYIAYHENGKEKLKGSYTNGAMNGEWKAFYDNGQLKEVVRFIDNQENGAFVEYHENGNLKAEGSYLEGDHEHGELKLYDETGDLYRKMNCDQGLCRTTWRRDPPEEE